MKIRVSVFIVCAALGSTGSALGYCRTTTCDPDASCADEPEKCCEYDEDTLCDLNGEPIAWPTSCVSYNTHDGGSPLRGITEEDLSEVLAQAFDSWLSVSCDGQPLSLAIEDRGVSSCGAPEFNDEKHATNANVWMFQDDPQKTTSVGSNGDGIDSSSLAISVITYDFKSAELVDVDVEFNTALADFTVGDERVNIDLLSVATHEAGHFLGLEHSQATRATMQARYTPGDVDPRTLSSDDQAGICAIYPPDRVIARDNQTCEPYGEYSPACFDKGCGCKVIGQGRSSADEILWSFALSAFWLTLVRRARRPERSTST